MKMSADILLDRLGDLPAPPGFRIIDSEVDFLRWATDDTPLLIRGQSLCAWAESFYSLRGQPYRYEESPSAILQRMFPALSSDQARRLSEKMGLVSISPDEVSLTSILNYCYPMDSSLWQGTVSPDHAARWLIWLCSHQPDEAEKVILNEFSHLLEDRAGNAPEGQVYRATNQESAKLLLYTWLGLTEDIQDIGLGEFPLNIPTDLYNEIRSLWMRRLIDSEGRFFKQMLNFPLSIRLRQELAQLAAQYYEQHSQHLTSEIIWQLQPYLSPQALASLEKHLPPPDPMPLPQGEEAVLNWFQSEYLPYRLWQARYNDKQAAKRVINLAQTFTDWYLRHYPKWLIQTDWISFQKSAHLIETAHNVVTFCVILDGLPAWDAEDIARSMYAKIDRLQIQEKHYCFAPLPTVTEFAKDALLKGVPPRLAPNTSPLGKILPDNKSPLPGLKDAKLGDIVFWCINQPDSAYHFESRAKRERQVRAELDSILHALMEVVEAVPAELALRVIITSDHGRLLNPKSLRRLHVPGGMQAHGRVAWGVLNQKFDEDGFSVDEIAGWVVAHGERFDMSHDMLIAWNEDSFVNFKTGSEPYPHGGLFPEEAIVPWFVFERDAKQPALQVTVTGKGEAGHSGDITATVVNPTHLRLECFSISFSHGPQVNGHWDILPLSKTEFTIALKPYPTQVDLASVKAILLIRQSNGAIFRIEVIPSLDVISLYTRDDSLLKDLDL